MGFGRPSHDEVGRTRLKSGRPGWLEEVPWHPFTRSLLDRALRASLVDGRANTALIERLIHKKSKPRVCQTSRYKMAG